MILSIFRRRFTFRDLKGAAFFSLARFSTSSTASETQNPSPKSNHLAQFLINSCGFSLQKAALVSKVISKFTSIEQADSVRHFFKHNGFDDASIQRLIRTYPRILSADVEKTLRPNFESLREMGFTAEELQLLISSNTYILACPLAIPRLEYWQTIIGTDSKKELVSVFAKNRGLIGQDIVSTTPRKISLLKDHGFSDADIVGLSKRRGWIISRKYDVIEDLLNKVKEIGFDPNKRSVFAQGLAALSCLGSRTFASRMEFFKGFGWSKQEFLDAFKKAPFFINLKEETIREKMEFLVDRVGCKQSYIASRPLLLAFSLEKRLKPRHFVMEELKANGIILKAQLYFLMSVSEKGFVDRFILPYKEQLPKLHETYVSARAGKISLK